MTTTDPARPVGPPVSLRIARAHAEHHRRTGSAHEHDAAVDDAVTHRMLAPHLARLALFVVLPTGLALLWLLLDYLAAMSSPSPAGVTIQTLLGLAVVVLYLAGIAAFLAPAHEPIAEHARVVEGGGHAAVPAMAWARRSAQERRVPGTVGSRRLADAEVLEFRRHAERATLIVRPSGGDLYVGWTMWRSRSPALLLAHFLRDTFGRFSPDARLHAEMRTAETRALLQSVHSLAREAATLATPPDTDAPPAPVAGPPTPSEPASSAPSAPSAITPVGAADAPWLRAPAARVPVPDAEWGPAPREG